jgi:hypothetical protein
MWQEKHDSVTNNGINKTIQFTLEDDGMFRIETWVEDNKVHNLLLTPETVLKMLKFMTKSMRLWIEKQAEILVQKDIDFMYESLLKSFEPKKVEPTKEDIPSVWWWKYYRS